MENEVEHPAFTRAKKYPEPWRSHFPKSSDEARVWRSVTYRRALAQRVLAVAHTRIEGTWSVYIDGVPGIRHDLEVTAVLDHGEKLEESIARILFPIFDSVPYAE